jgi:pyridoxamine 5'-phosphate oxidase family protein
MRAGTALSPAQLEYLLGERRLGRLATADAEGQPHVAPVGWRHNAELGTIDVGGRDLPPTKKFRNVRANPKVAFVVDDLASVTPWRPRSVMIQGQAEALDATDEQPALIRITPEKVFSWRLGLESA